MQIPKIFEQICYISKLVKKIFLIQLVGGSVMYINLNLPYTAFRGGSRVAPPEKILRVQTYHFKWVGIL